MEKIFNLETLGIIAAIIAIGMIAFSVYRHLRKVMRKKSPEAVQDFTGKFERRHYKFHNGLECYQEQLNLEQTEQLSVVLAEVNINEQTDLTLGMLSGALFEKKGLRRFLAIALRDTPAEGLDEKIGELTQDEVEAVLNDFFTLNPKMKFYFEILKIAVASQETTEARKLAGDLRKAQPAQ